jgi:hypothetical protein
MNKYKSLLLITAITTSIAGLHSCTKNKTEDMKIEASTCDSVKVISYKNDVQPLLNNNCGAQAGCHSTGSASGGVNLESWHCYNFFCFRSFLIFIDINFNNSNFFI